ncbi:MAG TPA: hypothetical protein HPP83_05545, partial [Candidatus Hydrogenedentes bacterium]|nr:hypothetical protein [Candidatus Hydrogenedentota bacterium]
MTKVADLINLLEKRGNTHALLEGSEGRVVVVAPSLAGRVLCMGFDGIDGETDSYVLPDEIEKGFTKGGRGGIWGNFGGDERIWLCPEAGKYGFFFAPGEDQVFENYLVPDALQTACYELKKPSGNGGAATFSASVSLVNYQGNTLDVEIVRQIEIVDSCPFTLGLEGAESVGFASRTTVRNTSDTTWTKEVGAPAIWTLGQFVSKEHSVVVLPIRPGPESDLGKPVSTEYFPLLAPDGAAPPSEYWSVTDKCVLLKANGGVQTKLEIPRRRATGRMASIDLAEFTMTVVEHAAYPELAYVCS